MNHNYIILKNIKNMKKLIDYFKSIGTDKWAHFGIGGLICALITIVVIFSITPITASWILLLSTIPGIVFVSMISLIKELTDSTGFSVKDIIAALIGCIILEIPLLIGIIISILKV